MRRTVGVAFKRDRWQADHGTQSELPFQFVILRLTSGQPQPPAIIVNHDVDVIRIVEGCCAALERSIIEVPFRRSDLPNELGKIAPVSSIAGPATRRRKIKLIPPIQFGFWRQRYFAGLLIADQISADRDKAISARRPKRRDNVGGSGTPVKTADGRLLDFERIHQSNDIGSNDGLLAVPDRVV